MICRDPRRRAPRVKFLRSFGFFAGLSVLFAVAGVPTGRSVAGAEPPPTLEARCEWQAQRSFLEIKDAADSDDEFRERNAEVSLDYQPYYNAAISRCLMVIVMSETSAGAVSHTTYMVDADNLVREYAFYHEISGLPIVCELRPAWGIVKFCASRDTFDAFVAPYMAE